MAGFSRKWTLCSVFLALSLFVACGDDDSNFLKQGEEQEEMSSGKGGSSSSKKRKTARLVRVRNLFWKVLLTNAMTTNIRPSR